jgi:DNA-binding winged helix-turn-helix (wHTH) protein
VQAPISFVTETLKSGNRVVVLGIVVIVAILSAAGIFLLTSLPDANAFNAQVERIFVENDNLRGQSEVKFLEILAQSATAFTEVLASYRMVIFVLMVFSASLLLAALGLLVTIVALNRRMSAIQRSGIQVESLTISREARAVYLNDMEFSLTDATLETIAVLAEARLDDEVLTGAQIEALISGRNEAECEEAAGATRIKRLRDSLGNQLVAELLVKTVARRGYVLSVARDAIRMR